MVTLGNYKSSKQGSQALWGQGYAHASAGGSSPPVLRLLKHPDSNVQRITNMGYISFTGFQDPQRLCPILNLYECK